MSNLFDITRCGLPVLPTLSFRFIENCSVPPAPAAIFDAPPIDVAFTPPIDPPCPEISADGTVTLIEGEEGTVDITSTVVQEDTDTGRVCRLELNFDFQIPQLCPTITATAGGGSVSVTQGDGCSYHFDFGFSGRPYRGILTSSVDDCTDTWMVDLYDGVTFLASITADRWLRGCCDSRPLAVGNRVWLSYEASAGWKIMSHEDITVAPVILTAAMSSGSATASFYYGDSSTGSLTVYDPVNAFCCAESGAKGWAVCNKTDGTGQWRLVQCQKKALWIEFTATEDFCDTDDEVRVSIQKYHWGTNPNPGGGSFYVKNTLGYENQGFTGKGIALQRGGGSDPTDCSYVIISMNCPPDGYTCGEYM